ncbi:MAG: HD-GYP domain-containing protein [Vicinamibacterales bacterium]
MVPHADRVPSLPLIPATPAAAGDIPTVLVVGDSNEVRAVARALGRAGVPAEALASAAAAGEWLDRATPAVLVVDIDAAHGEALALCRRAKRESATRLVPIILLSDDRRRDQRLAGIETGAEALLPKPFDPEELLARVRAFSRVSQYTSDLDSAASIIMTITAMIEARESAPGHCYRMANYATALGRALRLADADLTTLYRGAFLHDIGMLAIPDAILRKGGRLEPDEYDVIKSHPVIGDTLCANLRTLHGVRPIVRHHHERLDGSGYPDGLAGDAVPVLAQIVSIVDTFEAITMGREYVAARPARQALDVLRHEVHVGWRRPEIVDAFAALVQSGALETFSTPLDDVAAAELDAFSADLQRIAATPLLDLTPWTPRS